MTQTKTDSEAVNTVDLTVTVPNWLLRDINQRLEQTGGTLDEWLSRAIEERSALEISQNHLVGRDDDDITYDDERFAWASHGAFGKLHRCAEMRRQMLGQQERSA